MKYILAIDQGTTSTRAVLFDKSGKQCAVAQKEFTQFYPKPGWVEHSAEEIWDTVLYAVSEVLIRAKASVKDIAGVGITNQRETTVMWDKVSGVPVAHAICWQSRQSDYICEDIRVKGYEEMIREKTGLLIDPYFSATKIRWYFDNIPGLYERAVKGEVLFGTIDTWLMWKMTAGKVHATDYTNAARTLIYNIHELCWDKDLLALFDIPENILPSVMPSSSEYGLTDADSFLGINVMIGGVAGDQQAALFGQGCVKPGMAKSTYGTGCFMLMNTGEKPVRSKYGLVTTIACSTDEKINYALEGSVFVAGSAVQWLRDEMEMIDTSAESEKIAAQATDSGGVYVVPAFTGLGAPYWDMKVKGAVFGLTRGTTKAQFVRATLEALGYQTKDIFAAMEKDSGIKLDSVRVDGGAVKNNLLMQFLSDILQVKVIRPEDVETTVRGAAYLAGLTVGYWENTDELNSASAIDREFDFIMEKDKADELYDGWQEAVKATCSYHR